jgi:hypothetical protein
VIPNLAPEDLLLLLCVHGSKDSWKRLIWICDVATLVSMYKEMDWDRVVQQADALGSARMLFLGLGLAHDLLDLVLPEEIVHRMEADPMVASLLMEVRGRLFSEAGGLPGNDERFAFHLRVRERLRDRARNAPRLIHYYQWMTPHTIDRALLQLPVFLCPLYYLIWPLRLVCKHGLNPLRRRLKGLLKW